MAGAARRVGAETSATRARIVEATVGLIRDEGYAAASTRRVAARAGLKPSLVHYYFPTTDDLLLEVCRQGAADSDRMIDEALNSDDPVRALWGFFIDTSRTAMSLEFMALANHRPAVREMMAEHSAAMRQRQVDLLGHLLGDRIKAVEGFDPAGLSLILAGIGRCLVMEEALGVEAGHGEARAIVESWLDRLLPSG
ncbi:MULTISPECIES: TetR/AcrR family transcriptional regulator [Novosphingobium]|uniref:TetR/AcrR family transcriptional regulator n=1 Tax=Novosphingobium pentaromativorans TaxID=205844 RepID=A0A2W5NKV2_9SPHN|nr:MULTISPECIES: TetR/AcrR family transcriptional regulator [Novosphingobium]PZQ54071.1 MAG: TetR/AcrR family transcriptional regulator [Novosphingobium pentaromativorans]GFE76460.1 TetR family transcriptional regulator [Novosphingobium sp. TCA1]